MVDKSRHIIRERLEDYRRVDQDKERERLVAEWRRCYPEAANEARSENKPLMRVDTKQPGDLPEEPDEQWTNDTYYVTVRRFDTDPVFGTRGGMIQLGIAALEGTARHDWREFQAIKNQLVGEECEAFELYPAESRLLDPSNYYTLWCFPGIKRIKVGRPERNVLDAGEALAPQRALARDST